MPKQKRNIDSPTYGNSPKRAKLSKDTGVVKSINLCLAKFESQRRIGLSFYSKELLTCKSYSSMKCIKQVSCSLRDIPIQKHGDAIYNIEFSNDNKVMIAAGAKSDLFIFDPISHRKVKSCPSKHIDGVNCLKFIDSRLFTTCSDDQTIAIWDIRNLSMRVSTLNGHSGWVKDVSYIPSKNQLVSSGFDDTVRIWNINDLDSQGCITNEVVLNISYLTRTTLTEDCKTLVAATTTGHFFTINSLDIDYLKADVNSELQIFLGSLPSIPNKTHSRKRNCVELITDFPCNSNPWCITSVKVHPGDSKVLSRYSSMLGTSEWSVVHDITPNNLKEDEKCNRLNYFISEPTSATGYIKEVDFNEDGTLIVSPFGNGIRILSYNKACTNDNNYIINTYNEPKKFEEIKFLVGHRKPVLTAKFAFGIPLIASGSIDGHVTFYETRF